ncbi:aminopeptidase, partial [Anaerostipes caccae]|uniref:aminopeptidase n=1 Tax=Anaerostipes caccae TaxID=105841 RepID=UPI00241D548C
IIQALDEAGYVLITGRDGNETSMKVALHPLRDREKETNFENCVSDVNIPLGEVFTSPILKGTEGLLHVKNVYVEDYQFRNLRMVFKDGKVTEYSCGNFEDAGAAGAAGNDKGAGAAGNDKAAGAAGDARRQGQALVKQVIMRNHDWLPLGEFAIGTNTTAYAVARRFSIGDKLPILIAEKMGPHFAVGDTCYSFAEDSPMYNPDGREVIARDNEISLLRKTDMSKAYFSCHTDITIPYEELDSICVIGLGGRKTALIKEGKFVLPGTEILNEPLT